MTLCLKRTKVGTCRRLRTVARPMYTVIAFSAKRTRGRVVVLGRRRR